jgi:hypothetical protein
MAKLAFKNILTTAGIMLAFAPQGVRAQASFTPAGAAIQHNQTVTTEEENIKYRKVYGNLTLLELGAKEECKDYVKDILGFIADDFKSPIMRKAFSETKLNDYVDNKGNFQSRALENKVEIGFKKEIYDLAHSGITLKDAMERDTVIAKYINKGTYGILSLAHAKGSYHFIQPAHAPTKEFIEKTAFSELFNADGTAKQQMLEKSLFKLLGDVPLRRLGSSELYPLLDSIPQKDRIGLRGYLRADNETPSLPHTISDIFVSGTLKADATKIKAIVNECSIYDYCKKDPNISLKYQDMEYFINSGPPEVQEHLKNTPILKVINERTDAIDYKAFRKEIIFSLSHTPVTRIPGRYSEKLCGIDFEELNAASSPAIRDILKQTTLSQLVNTYGEVSRAKLCQVVLGPIKDKPIKSCNEYFLTGLLGPEAAASVVIDNDKNTARGALRQEMINKPVSIFLIDDDIKFNIILQEFIEKACPPKARAAYAIKPAFNVWEKFKEIPYSFNVSGNVKVPTSETINMPAALSQEEKAIAYYSMWEMTQSANVKFKEFDTLPDNKGIVFSNAALISVSYYGKVWGIAVGAYQDQKLVNVVYLRDGPRMENYFATYPHEIEHALGLHHTHDGNSLPGVVSTQTVQTAPGLDTDSSVMSYTRTHNLQITPMEGDRLALDSLFTPKNSNNGSSVMYTVHVGSLNDVVANRDPHIIWVSSKDAYAQNTVTDLVNTIDLRSVKKGGKHIPATIMEGYFDLSKGEREFALNANGQIYTLLLSTHGKNIENAVMRQGELIGTTGNNILQLTDGGILDGNGGSDVLFGAKGKTTFFAGKLHSDAVFSINGDKTKALVRDVIGDFAPGDKITAPEGTTTYKIRPLPNGHLDVDFLDDKGLIKRAVEFLGHVKVETIDVRTVDGDKIQPSFENSVSRPSKGRSR